MNSQILFYTNSDENGYTNKTFQYILGFQPSYWYILEEEWKLTIFLDSRYFNKTENINQNNINTKLWTKIKIKYQLLKDDIEIYLDQILDSKNISIEESVSLAFFEKIKKIWYTINIIPEYFKEKRIIKQIDEINNIKNAISIIEKVHQYIKWLNLKWLLIWQTEKNIKEIIISKIFEFGWDWESFDSIVAFWKNSAIPHHTCSNTLITDWPLLIDMWAIYNWYCSDFTRTMWVWERSWEKFNKYCKIKEIVKHASMLSFKKVKIWVKACDIDSAARSYIEKEWYWPNFTHSTWHWVWLDIHESPKISSKSTEIIKKWMVFTIEPWIYLNWKFWVRYENIVII